MKPRGCPRATRTPQPADANHAHAGSDSVLTVTPSGTMSARSASRRRRSEWLVLDGASSAAACPGSVSTVRGWRRGGLSPRSSWNAEEPSGITIKHTTYPTTSIVLDLTGFARSRRRCTRAATSPLSTPTTSSRPCLPPTLVDHRTAADDDPARGRPNRCRRSTCPGRSGGGSAPTGGSRLRYLRSVPMISPGDGAGAAGVAARGARAGGG
jgi:hypothetical protein